MDTNVFSVRMKQAREEKTGAKRTAGGRGRFPIGHEPLFHRQGAANA